MKRFCHNYKVYLKIIFGCPPTLCFNVQQKRPWIRRNGMLVYKSLRRKWTVCWPFQIFLPSYIYSFSIRQSEKKELMVICRERWGFQIARCSCFTAHLLKCIYRPMHVYLKVTFTVSSRPPSTT